MSITLDGTNGITTPDVTSSGALNVNASAPDNSLVVDASGNAGVGVTPSAWDTTFTAAFQVGTAALTGTSGNNNALASNAYYNAGWKYNSTTTATLFQQISGQHRWYTAPSGTAGNAISFTQAMTLDSSGNLLVGTTGTLNNSNTVYRVAGANNPCLTLFKNSSANTDNAFCVANGVSGGTNSFIVLANGNALNTNNSYGAISDVRLKENIEDATPKLADLLQVKIRQYNLIADEEKQKQLGVVADELEAVFPAMVTEDNDGFKNVKYSVFVPMLIKAMQEQQAIIEEQKTALEAQQQAIAGLTARVEALEANNV